ncbi:KilA-N domain-containing protein [Maritalea porphyrae]|uniref:KilA-N domain-containing protein n=1 Tax=Maritalea porphyrae TaxID=880732 RepID=UPI0022AFE4B8|nr:KilA-N domain-containing protein [Maritalea porphyrae]MCZ4270880.1 KilA-N domain-containing protein [Maritalea porphyrae]
MNELIKPEIQPLVYNSVEISVRDEKLSLTNMWRAAGSPPNQSPSQWLRTPNAKGFVEAVSFNVGKSHIELVTSKRGGSHLGTFAHWQIALAYMKYLSHDFHMWGNEVIRERMEGKSIAVHDLPDDIKELLRRDDGMLKMLAKKITAMEQAFPLMVFDMSERMIEPMVRAKLAENNILLRHGRTAKQIWDRYDLPGKLRGSSTWFGNRLNEMGCSIADEGRADIGSGTVRLFDPDKAALCMRNGLKLTAERYAIERQGQKKLRFKQTEQGLAK